MWNVLVFRRESVVLYSTLFAVNITLLSVHKMLLLHPFIY